MTTSAPPRQARPASNPLLRPCRFCEHPVAPLGGPSLSNYGAFWQRRRGVCPSCGGNDPHPDDHRKLTFDRRLAIGAVLVLGGLYLLFNQIGMFKPGFWR